MTASIEKKYKANVVASFEKSFGRKVDQFIVLPPSGSDRFYFRIHTTAKSYIACWYNNVREKEAFVYFTKHFHAMNLKVPEFLSEDAHFPVYFVEDLGGNSLSSLVFERSTERLSTDLMGYYEKVLDDLIDFQVKGVQGLDFSKAYPRSSFDKRSIIWDLYYFKYYFLKINMDFDEEFLENDFEALTTYLIHVDANYFMYRDFQSRNILIKDEEMYYIDYQGGRKGSLHYDLASLLFQAKARIPIDQREVLLTSYVEKLGKYMTVDPKKFRQDFSAFVLVRTLQVLGAYGYRGMIQQKSHFLESIPSALETLRWCLEHWAVPGEWQYLYQTLKELLYKMKS